MWQELYATFGDVIRLVGVAEDVQGPDLVLPWTQAAGVTFPTLVDAEGTLASRLGLTAVPVALFLDEQGRLAARPGRIDIRDDRTRAAVHAWARRAAPAPDLSAAAGGQAQTGRTVTQARAWLRLAHMALTDGDRRSAAAALDRAWELDPDNWVVRKQRWALRHPDRFYGAAIDADWQQAQIDAEAAAQQT